jgi:apolipoprotein N-acyltransferase
LQLFSNRLALLLVKIESIKMNKLLSNNLLLAFLAALLLIPGWYEWGTGFTLYLAFIPILLIMENLSGRKRAGRRVFLYASVTFFLWNLATTWWIKNATFPGMLAAVFLTTFFMSIPVWLAFKARQVLGRNAGFFAFIVFWLAYEFSYMHGEISWPWLTLGHGFAYEVKNIQWYELTGVFGGSLWFLLVNVFLYQAIFQAQNKVFIHNKKLIIAGAILIIPLVISNIRYYTYTEKVNPRKMVVVQPNMDPYLKFNDIPPIEHARIQINEAIQHIDSTVDFIVTPETSLLGNFWIGSFEGVQDIQLIRQLIKNNPDCNYVAGIVCRQLYEPGDEIPPTARPMNEPGYYYDYYNSAILVDTSSVIQLYHKSQLVTGIEKMPYTRQLKFLKKLMINLGGTFRSNATQEERDVFKAVNDSILIAPVICWESVFGDYVTDYIKKGAHFIFVITNDGWWGDTPGYRQHNSLSSIRAIETRRSIARSANTGISSFINQRGDVLQKIGWWERGALVDTLNANDKITFYVKHGDYIGRIAFYTGIFLILFVVAAVLKGKKGGLS